MRMRDGRITNLRISLPPNFPQGRPALSVTHPIRHPWVDSAGRLSFPALDGWASGRSRIAAVVAEASTSLSGQPARADASPSPQRPSSEPRNDIIATFLNRATMACTLQEKPPHCLFKLFGPLCFSACSLSCPTETTLCRYQPRSHSSSFWPSTK